jgi:hypothetical protein
MKIKSIRSLLGFVYLFLGTQACFGDLFIVDSGRNRVLLASSFDGSILNPDLIVDNSLQTPVNAIDSGRGTIFLSDQVLDQVREYSYTGSFLGTVVSNTQVDNIRGIAVRDNALYVTNAGSGAGANRTNTVQRFDLASGAQSTFIAATDSSNLLRLGSPWDVTFRDSDVLVSDSTVDTVQRYDLSGNFLSTFSSISISFPQQVNVNLNGDVTVGNNTGGIVRLGPTGSFLEAVGPTTARGVFQLGNGNYLYGSGNTLGVYNPMTMLTTSLITDNASSFRYIEATAVPEPTSIALLSIASGALVLKRRRAKKIGKMI